MKTDRCASYDPNTGKCNYLTGEFKPVSSKDRKCTNGGVCDGCNKAFPAPEEGKVIPLVLDANGLDVWDRPVRN